MSVSDLTRQPLSHDSAATLVDHSTLNDSASMKRCPTTSTTSSPRTENDDISETTHTETSCDSFNTLKPSSSPMDSAPCNCTAPVTLHRIYQDNLSVEILTLFEELLPSCESYNRRMGLIRKIEKLLNTEWPNRDICVHLFGSSVNDLGTSYSDVDLCITTSLSDVRNVRTLAKLFRKSGMQQVVCVPRAKVPIVRLFDPESQLACDINVNNTLAIQNTRMMKTYVALDPRVRPLAMILKHWTKHRRLNDAANGGTLSSYTWTCIIVNFLQMRSPPILPVLHHFSEDQDNFDSDKERFCGFGSANHESLGGLLFAFFRRFAVEFDYDEHVVSVRHGKYLSKREKGWHIGRNRDSLCVEEPFNVSRNLGNSADAASVKGIRLEFCRALHLLVQGASLDVICQPYEPPVIPSLFLPYPNTATCTTSPSPENRKQHAIPLPSFVLPVHPHSVDIRNPKLRQRSVDNVYLQPSPLISMPAPASTPSAPSVPTPFSYELSYLQTPDTLPRLRTRLSSSTTYSPTPIIRMRGPYHSSQSIMHNETSPKSPVATFPKDNRDTLPADPAMPKCMDTHTLDSIFARYNDRARAPDRQEAHGQRRRSNAQSNQHHNHRNGRHQDHRRTGSGGGSGSHHTRQTRWKSSSSGTPVLNDWPPASSSTSSTKQNQLQQHHTHQRRRKWSTAKKQQQQQQQQPQPQPQQQQQQQKQKQKQKQQQKQHVAYTEPNPVPIQRLEETYLHPQPRVHFPRRRNSKTPVSAPPSAAPDSSTSSSSNNNNNNNNNNKTKKSKSHSKTS